MFWRKRKPAASTDTGSDRYVNVPLEGGWSGEFIYPKTDAELIIERLDRIIELLERQEKVE